MSKEKVITVYRVQYYSRNEGFIAEHFPTLAKARTERKRILQEAKEEAEKETKEWQEKYESDEQANPDVQCVAIHKIQVVLHGRPRHWVCNLLDGRNYLRSAIKVEGTEVEED